MAYTTGINPELRVSIQYKKHTPQSKQTPQLSLEERRTHATKQHSRSVSNGHKLQ